MNFPLVDSRSTKGLDCLDTLQVEDRRWESYHLDRVAFQVEDRQEPFGLDKVEDRKSFDLDILDSYALDRNPNH
jgi:hypothetical protein